MRSFFHPPQSMRERLEELAGGAGLDEQPDRYGGGKLLEDFEAQIATLLGKEAAVFMPSGTMAQQIALRIHAERTQNSLVALHPQSHLIVSEEDAYQRLSGLRGVPLGDSARLFTLADLQAIKERAGTLLIELPERNLGGPLRPWDDLVKLVHFARERGMRVHLDGARVWESQPYYARPYAEMCAPFDTVYVSFYKILNGIAGAALAGPADVIAQARVWQQRHGGRLVQLYPYILSARMGLQRYLPRMQAYRDRAVQIASVLGEFQEMLVTPNPPDTNMMHVYVRGDAASLDAAMTQIASDTGLALFGGLSPSPVPGYHKFERSIGEGAFEIADQEIRSLFTRLFVLAKEDARA